MGPWLLKCICLFYSIIAYSIRYEFSVISQRWKRCARIIRLCYQAFGKEKKKSYFRILENCWTRSMMFLNSHHQFYRNTLFCIRHLRFFKHTRWLFRTCRGLLWYFFFVNEIFTRLSEFHLSPYYVYSAIPAQSISITRFGGALHDDFANCQRLHNMCVMPP